MQIWLATILIFAGAAAMGWFIAVENKTKRWFHFEILSIGAHGFMLAFMGFAAFLPFLRSHMFTVAVITAIVPIVRAGAKLFDRPATK